MKFAVASQEGVAVVWDVRSSKPLKIFETDRTRGRERRATGEASGFIYEEDLWDWSRGGSRAPGWGIRSIKFSPEGADGKEVLVFTEVGAPPVEPLPCLLTTDLPAYVLTAFD